MSVTSCFRSSAGVSLCRSFSQSCTESCKQQIMNHLAASLVCRGQLRTCTDVHAQPEGPGGHAWMMFQFFLNASFFSRIVSRRSLLLVSGMRMQNKLVMCTGLGRPAGVRSRNRKSRASRDAGPAERHGPDALTCSASPWEGCWACPGRAAWPAARRLPFRRPPSASAACRPPAASCRHDEAFPPAWRPWRGGALSCGQRRECNPACCTTHRLLAIQVHFELAHVHAVPHSCTLLSCTPSPWLPLPGWPSGCRQRHRCAVGWQCHQPGEHLHLRLVPRR
jgi:hypothetical protein